MIFELIQKTFDRDWQRLADLDSKVANLVGFTGVIVGFVLGSASFMQPKVAQSWTLITLFVLSILALLSSFVLGIAAFAVREWMLVPEPNKLIRGYADGTFEELLVGVGGAIAKAETIIRSKLDTKAKEARAASVLTLVGLVLSFIFILTSIVLG
jgi:hypothetical protein